MGPLQKTIKYMTNMNAEFCHTFFVTQFLIGWCEE